MKEVIRPRLKALSAMLILLLAAYFAFLIPSGTALELHDRDSDTRIASWPIRAGDELSLEIEHSFEHIPWYEFYTVTDDLQFDLDRIAVAGYGAGIPAEMDVPTHIENGLVLGDLVWNALPGQVLINF